MLEELLTLPIFYSYNNTGNKYKLEINDSELMTMLYTVITYNKKKISWNQTKKKSCKKTVQRIQ